TKEDIKKLFFSTDHHWKPYLALQTYSEMGKMLIDEYGIDIDTKSLDVNNYNIDVYKNSFLGSHGKRTGKIYAGLDDFEIIYPKFETKLKVNLCGFEREGDYEKTMINRRHLSNKDIYNVNTFSTYANSGLQSKVENLMTNSSSNIFLITDSYSMPSICFMSTGVKYLEQVDLRYVDENYLLKESILEAKPDIVIIQYNPGAFTDNKLFNFN
ncbi:MAG: hypothetical protein GYA87_09820, partial [Christensenellaceae bacterium]|nr:hypothetical protein [Christensenellaceae bacterium]